MTEQQERRLDQALAGIPSLSEEDARGVRTALARMATIADPVGMIVFGSRARGEASAWSDLDVLVILPDGADRDALWDRMAAAVRGTHPAIDIVPTSRTGYEERSPFPFFVEQYARNEGVVVYER